MGTESTLIRSVQEKEHRRLWILFGTKWVKLERAKYRLHVKIDRSGPFFRFARVNGPSMDLARNH